MVAVLMPARRAASPIRIPAIEAVWHLELDFKVKRLDLERGFNVYKGPVPVMPVWKPVPEKGARNEADTCCVRQRSLRARHDRSDCRVPGDQWRLLSTMPVLPLNSETGGDLPHVAARLASVTVMATLAGTRARVARMRRVVGILLLVVVGFGAVWCVDGCVDPTREASGPVRSSGSGAPCVICVVPFTTTARFSLPVQRAQLRPVADRPVVHLWSAPVFSIDHPPRTL